MDRLISEQQVLYELVKLIDRYGQIYHDEAMKAIKAIQTAEPKIVPIANIHFDEDKMREVCKEVAENIVVEYDFKGKTNGEVIKMLYPQGEIVKGLYGISGNPLICVNLNISTECSEMVFTEDWWNSPYEPQENCDTCKHKDDGWDSEHCDGCCGNHSGFEPQERSDKE